MSEPLYCVNHPKVETYLRCNKCDRPICAKCAVQTPVGYRCRDCISNQQQVFYVGFRPVYYLVALIVALPLALITGWLVPSLDWFAAILGPLAGGLIANVAHWAIGRRRGPYTWLVVCAAIVVGALPKLFMALIILAGSAFLQEGAGYTTSGLMALLWTGVYLVTALGAAYAWLRPGRPT